MPVVMRTLTKAINLPLLLEELSDPLVYVKEVDLRGYIQESPRKHIPRTSPNVYQTRMDKSTDGKKKELIAQPGEIYIETTKGLTIVETQALDQLLKAHDYTKLTATQAKENITKTDLADIMATLAAGKILTLEQLTNLARITIEREG